MLKCQIMCKAFIKLQMYGEYNRLDQSTDMLYITTYSTDQFVLMCWRIAPVDIEDLCQESSVQAQVDPLLHLVA